MKIKQSKLLENQLKKIFQTIDVSGNGIISKQEIYLLTNRLRKQYNQQNIDNIIEACDVDTDEFIDFDKFKEIAMHIFKRKEKQPTQEELLYVFELFDSDGNHLITFKQFWKLCKKVDRSIGRYEAERMFQEMDLQKKGEIDFGRFIDYYQGKGSSETQIL